MALGDFLAASDPETLKREARTLWIQNLVPTSMFEAFNDYAMREHARAHSKRMMNAPPAKPVDYVAKASRNLEQKQIALNELEQRMRDARKEESVLKSEINSLDARTSSQAEGALEKLIHRLIPDLQLAIKEQQRRVEDVQAELRRLRSTPPPKEKETGPSGPIWS